MQHIACIVIGAGVVGLAIARRLSQTMPCAVLEANAQVGLGISSRNSGVIHAGLYYPPAWLKSQLCIKGKQLLYAYAEEKAITHQRCGKLIVATSQEQLDALKTLQKTAQNNQLNLQWLDKAAIKQLEPELFAEAALYSQDSGIIDVNQYCQQLALDIETQQGVMAFKQEVTRIQKTARGFELEINRQEKISCDYLINAAGLNAQHIANLAQCQNIPPLYYCKGQYFTYQGKSPFKHLIYPLPLKNQQGLGIHATLDVAGQLRFGPDAIYCKQLDYRVDPCAKEPFLQAIGDYFPHIDASKLHPDYSGIRPKLSASGHAAQDFLIQLPKQHHIDGLINLFGIESPGITASLAIAEHVEHLLQSKVKKLR